MVSTTIPSRIIGLGPGLAVLVLAGAAAGIICLVATKSSKSSILNFFVLSVYAAIVAVLLSLPRTGDTGDASGYQRLLALSAGKTDSSVLVRGGLLILGVLGVLGGWIGILMQDTLQPVYASPYAGSLLPSL
ncbi:hypothetical protein BC828DRAFT_379430 [Blastocladiella britannica]|nr:hypothetical protein BC828DRAFT_379430 [Blastocladiella britannica]